MNLPGLPVVRGAGPCVQHNPAPRQRFPNLLPSLLRMRVRWIRKSHRWLGLFVGLQLLLWTLSGLYFSWNPIERVRGEDLAAPLPVLSPSDTSLVSPGRVLAALTRSTPTVEAVEAITLRALLGQPVYEVAYRAGGSRRYVLADARTGALRPPLSQEEAVAIAQRDFVPDVPVREVTYLEAVEPDAEYRGKELPAYRVSFEHETGTRLYVSATRGLVTARRNDTWRTFDFFWMLHVMDYQARDNFNHWLLRALSVLGVITVLSGFWLWAVTSPWLRRRSRPPFPPGKRPANTRPVVLPTDGKNGRPEVSRKKPNL